MILRARDIKKVYTSNKNTYPTEVLKGIDVELNKGEFVAMMGPSGSGKTTCLNVFAGIDKPTEGTIEIEGKEISNYSEDELNVFRRQKLGFVFQDFNLLDSLTLQQNIMLPMILEKMDYQYMEERSKEILTNLDILSIKDKYPYQVSGGQKQRAAIGRALVNNPALILADEPTGNLDSKTSSSIMRYLSKLNEIYNCTILMVTHSPESSSYCTRVLFMQDGKIDYELNREKSRKDFYNEILSHLATYGGETDEI